LVTLSYENLNVTGLAAVAPVLTNLVEEPLKGKGKVQGGRDLIDKLHDTLNEMPSEEYLMMHYLMSSGPFVDQFDWGRMTLQKKKDKTSKKNVRVISLTPIENKKPGFTEGEVILSVKPQFAGNWTDYSECATAKTMKRRGDLIERVYVWSKGFDLKFLTPTLKAMSFSSVYKYMNHCRNFRGTDEQGLSGWGCGFGASGNPNRLQARLNRKLALILGAMMDNKGGPVIVEDAQENELIFLKTYTDLWSSKSSLIKREVFFKCANTSLTLCQSLGDSRFTNQSSKLATNFIFPNLVNQTSKASEWAKTDAAMTNFLESYFPSKQLKEEESHLIVSALLYSEVFFKSEKCAVYGFGAQHNMYGYLSNQPVVVASCTGETEWEISAVKLPSKTIPDFLKTVCVHNGHRTGYFLNPQYFFNPQMNFLRHVPGKTIDLEKGTVLDVIGYSIIQEQVVKKQLEKNQEPQKKSVTAQRVVEETSSEQSSEDERTESEEEEEQDGEDAEEDDQSQETAEESEEEKPLVKKKTKENSSNIVKGNKEVKKEKQDTESTPMGKLADAVLNF